MSSRRLYSTNSVFVSKCREALRSKRAELPARIPPACNDGLTQKTLIPYYIKPTVNTTLSVNIPTSVFESQNLKLRYEKEQKIETELWVKAAYLHEFKQKGGKSKNITLKPFVEEFIKTGKADSYLSYYLEKHKDKLAPIVRDLSQKRNDVLKHNTFWKMEEASKEERSSLSIKHVTIQDLKDAAKDIQEAKTPEEQVIAVQKYVKLRELYVKPEQEQSSHLTGNELHKKRVEAELKRLFNSIVINKVDPNTLSDRISAFKKDYIRLQRMPMPSEEIDLYDVYFLEQNLLSTSEAAKRFLEKAKVPRTIEDEEMIKILLSYIEEGEKTIQKSLPDNIKKVRSAFLKANRNRSILESSQILESNEASKIFQEFLTEHGNYINGTISILETKYPEYKEIYGTLRELYQLKRKITEKSPFRQITNIDSRFSSIKLKDIDVEKEIQTYKQTRYNQLSFLQAHYDECATILSREHYEQVFREQLEVLSSLITDETLSLGLKELKEIAQDATERSGLQEYLNSVGTAESFNRDIKYLQSFSELAKHVRRVNQLESVFGINAIDKSLELLEEQNITLEPPRYRRFLQSDVPAYKLKWVDTYSAHPGKKQRSHDRKVKLTVTKESLKEKLSPAAFDRLIHISGKRYRSGEGVLVLQGSMFQTREENCQYVTNLLGALIREAQRADLYSEYIIPAKVEKLSPLEKLALEYSNVEQEDVQSHDLLSHWIGYLRKGKLAGADEIYGEGLDHQTHITFETSKSEDSTNFENIEEITDEEFEEYLQKLQSV